MTCGMKVPRSPQAPAHSLISRRCGGYTIAVEALGRAENFDPQLDPIVRVEATRLRRTLARYYANGGKAIRPPPAGC